MPTGSADAALINALKTGAQPDTGDAAKPISVAKTAEGDTAAEPGTIYEIADAARIELDSYRFAKRVTPSDGDETSAISASDSDNVLILFEGTLESLALAAKDASWDYSATLTLDGKYDYECTFAVEQNDGQSFGTALLPLSKGKFIAYAEVPAAVQTHGRSHWSWVTRRLPIPRNNRIYNCGARSRHFVWRAPLNFAEAV